MIAFAREASDRLVKLLSSERAATVEFVVELAEFNRRRHWEALGYSSLFQYLMETLHLPKSEAYYRVTAARLVFKFPQIVEPLRDGRIALSALPDVANAITLENCDEILPRFFHQSVRESKVLAAAINPVEAPARRDVILKVGPTLVQTFEPTSRQPAFESLNPNPKHDSAQPLTEELHRIHCTVSKRVLKKLQAAKAALSHRFPKGRIEDILEAGLDLLLEKDAKKKGLVKKPRKIIAKPKELNGSQRVSSAVPAAVKRAVWTRDGGECQWPLDSGGICASTHQVEEDHIIPRAHGGPSTIANVRLTCRSHVRRESGAFPSGMKGARTDMNRAYG